MIHDANETLTISDGRKVVHQKHTGGNGIGGCSVRQPDSILRRLYTLDNELWAPGNQCQGERESHKEGKQVQGESERATIAEKKGTRWE